MRNLRRFIYWQRYKRNAKIQQQQREFQRLRRCFYDDIWQQAASEMGAKIESLGYGFTQISISEKSILLKGDKLPFDNSLAIELAGNKPLSYKLITDLGGSVPNHRQLRFNEYHKALQFFTDRHGDLVLKPAFASGGGEGVITGINTEKALRKAFNFTSRLCDDLIIEEQVPGSSFRILVLDGKFIDAVRRDPPNIIGDGVQTIKQLVEQENHQRIHSPFRALSPIEIDLEMHKHLALVNKQLSSIPETGEKIILKRVVNQNCAHDNHNVRHEVHESTIALCEKLASQHFRLAGIDIMTPDISKPLNTNGGVVNEINANPGLHHHLLLSEAPDWDITQALLRQLIASDNS